MTVDKLRAAVNRLEEQGDWETAELVNAATDLIIIQDTKVKAYELALSKNVVIKIAGKKTWFNSE